MRGPKPGIRRGKYTGRHKATLLKQAYALLEVTATEVAALPKISHLIKPAGNTVRIIEYLKHSEEPGARAVCKQAERLGRDSERPEMLAAISIEALCAAAGVAPKKLFGIIATEVAEQSAQATMLLSKAMHPKVLEKTIAYAMEPDGSADRKMIHQAEQYLPVPKTSVTFAKQIDARTQVQNVAILKPLEDSMKRLSDRFMEIAPVAPVADSTEESETEE